MANPFPFCRSRGACIDPNWILCGNGSDDILTIVTRALVGEGESLRFPYPSYISIARLAELQDARSLEDVHFQPDWTLPGGFADACAGVKLVILGESEQPVRHGVPPQQVLELAEAVAVSAVGR